MHCFWLKKKVPHEIQSQGNANLSHIRKHFPTPEISGEHQCYSTAELVMGRIHNSRKWTRTSHPATTGLRTSHLLMIGAQDYWYQLCENWTLDDIETIWTGVRRCWRCWLSKLGENFCLFSLNKFSVGCPWWWSVGYPFYNSSSADQHYREWRGWRYLGLSFHSHEMHLN